MRKVFESRRIENVEAVARLLGSHGIEARVHGGRGWRGAIRGNFSYRDHAQQREMPSLWVVHSNDQTRARELLREAGLLPDPRAGGSSYLPQTVHGDAGKRRRGQGGMLRGMLIAAVLLVGAFLWLRGRTPPPPPPQPAATARPAAEMAIASAPQPYAAAMPTALAHLLLEQIHGSAQSVCVAIDGEDPAPEWLQQAGAHVQPASSCEPGAVRMQIGGYMTDGMGSGTAEVTRQLGEGVPERQRLQVEREGLQWHILGPARD